MLNVSADFKTAMKQPIKQLDAYIRIDDETNITSSDDLVSFKLSCDTGMCKTAMRKIEAKYLGEHNLVGKWVHIGLGVKLPNSSYEYIDYGSFLVTESTNVKDTGVTTIIGYDKMINTMQEYKVMDVAYPMSLYDYTKLLCTTCGLDLANSKFTTHNDWNITKELWGNISGITYRDILVQIAQITGTTCIINADNKIYFKTISDTEEIITYDNLLTLKLKPKYGEINSVILSRTPQEDNIYLKDDDSIEVNGLTEFKIENNEIVDKDRESAITPIYNALHGISYYPFEATTEGLGWYEIADKITLINDTGDSFETVLFNFSIVVDGSIKEILKTTAETKTQTQYQYASTIAKRIANTEIIVNKQEQTIKAIVETQDEQAKTMSEITQDNQSITQKVSNIEKTVNETNQNVDTALDKIDKTVAKVDVEYYLSTSATTLTGGSWSTDAPNWENGKYIWSRNKFIYVDSTTAYSNAVCITGARGSNGSNGADGKSAYQIWLDNGNVGTEEDYLSSLKGADGQAGLDGVGVISSNVTYQASTSGTTAPTGTWLTSIPSISAGQYLWTRTIITYSDGKTTVSYSVSKNGTNGTSGKDGKGISSTAVTYQVGTNGTSAPTGTWSASIPSASAGQYLWTRTVITYTDTTSTTSYSVAKYGTNGTNGSDGVGIASIEEWYYLSTSATSLAGGSWSTTYQGWSNGKYIWVKTVFKYTDNTTKETTPICVSGTKGETGATGGSGKDGADGLGIVNVDVLYYQSTSSTSLNGGSWSSTVPVWANGKYIWTKTKTTYSDSTYDETSPVCITGAKGETGATGSSGKNGVDGRGIKTTTITYQVSTSGTSVPTGTWDSTIPSISAGQYLWTRTIITYSDNTTSTSYSISRSGTNGSNGSDGKGIKSTSVTYQAGASGTTAPTGTWSSSPPNATAGQYVWTRTIITYTDSSTTTAYSVAKYGINGTDGNDGLGISKIIEQYYLSTSNTAQTDGTWGEVSSWASDKYLWTRSQITWTDNTVTYSTPVLAEAINTANSTSNSALTSANNTSAELSDFQDTTNENLNKLEQDTQDKLDDLENNQNEKYSELSLKVDNIVASIQNTGGNNLIKNSVMFAYDMNNIPTNWEIDGSGTLLINSSAEALANGGASGHTFTLLNKTVRQTVYVKKDTGEESKTYYSFSTKIKKDTTGTCYIKLYNSSEEYLVELKSGESSFYGVYEIKGLLPKDNYYILEFYGSSDSNATFTDNMLAIGEYKSQWTQANGEIMNTQVNINVDGVLVKSSVYLGDYTIMSPLEFAGYSNINGVLTKVFSLNKDTTLVKKLVSEDEFKMVPIKIVPITTGNLQGWAFVKSS